MYATQHSLATNCSHNQCVSDERSGIKRWFDAGNKKSPITNCELSSTKLIPNRLAKQLITALYEMEKNEKTTPVARAKELAAAVSGTDPSDFKAIAEATVAIESYLKSKAPDVCLPNYAIDDIRRKVGLARDLHGCNHQCVACQCLLKLMLQIEETNASSMKRTMLDARELQMKSKISADAHKMHIKQAEKVLSEAQDAHRAAISAHNAYVTLMTRAQKEMDMACSMGKFSDSTNDVATEKMELLKEIKGAQFDEHSMQFDESDPKVEQAKCSERVISKLKKQVAELCLHRDQQDGASSCDSHFRVREGITKYLLRYQDASMVSVEELCYLALHKDDPLAMALCYEKGLHVFKRDINKAREILEMLSELHSDCLEINFAMYQCLQRLGEASAMQHLERAAHGGLPCAQVEMFLRLRDITKTTRDEWLLKAKDGNIAAAFRLHAMLKHGGIDLDAEDLDFVDTSKSEQDQEWAKKCVADMYEAHDRGDLWAAYWLGIYYKKGFGVPQNINTARDYFLIAADAPNVDKDGRCTRGISAAMYEYGLIMIGDTVDEGIHCVSLKEGAEWIMRACRMHHYPAERYVEFKWRTMVADASEESSSMFSRKLSVGNPCHLSCEIQRFECQSSLAGFETNSFLQNLTKLGCRGRTI